MWKLSLLLSVGSLLLFPGSATALKAAPENRSYADDGRRQGRLPIAGLDQYRQPADREQMTCDA